MSQAISSRREFSLGVRFHKESLHLRTSVDTATEPGQRNALAVFPSLNRVPKRDVG